MPLSDAHAARRLTLPGWGGSGAGHWQTEWERLHGCIRVEQADWAWPKRGDWMARLDEVVLGDARPALLIAHSLGCQLVAAWAAHSRHTARVAGALLVAIPDTARADMPPPLAGWRTVPRGRLPFPALAIASADDPYCTPERALAYVSDWGAEQRGVGSRGHLNADSGLGAWDEGWAIWNDWLHRR